jgi:hypothetical protein
MVVSWDIFKEFCTSRTLSIQYVDLGEMYDLRLFDGGFSLQCSIIKDTDECAEFEATFKANGNKKIGAIEVGKLPPQQPYAEPTYRTKHAKRDDAVTVANGSSADIDYVMPVERYASGGTIVIKNPQFGDWIEASIQDPNGTIPEPYRVAICENWPLVAQYIEGQYIEVTNSLSIYTKQGIDTRPLVAKINPGLVLRVTYHAADIADAPDRQVLVNYFLSKKL